MNVTLKNNGVFESIAQEIARIPNLTEEREKVAMKEIGKVISNAVKAELPKSDSTGLNYDGSRPYVHMRNDVKTTIKRRNGFVSVTVHGGRKTAFKWHLLDDGVRGTDGRQRVRGIHFTQAAMKKATTDIEKIVDALIDEVANG